jgi:Voltage gated chloride channel
LCGFAAVAFTRLFEELGDFVDHLKIVPNFLHPAVGALGLGIVGFCFPCVLGSGYDTIEDILNNHLVLGVVLLVLILKSFVVPDGGRGRSRAWPDSQVETIRPGRETGYGKMNLEAATSAASETAARAASTAKS